MEPEQTLKLWMNLNGTWMDPEIVNGTWIDPQWNLNVDPQWNLNGSPMESERTLNGSQMDAEILNGLWMDPEWTYGNSLGESRVDSLPRTLEADST